LFTYDDVDPAFNHRELDIEFSLLFGGIPPASGNPVEVLFTQFSFVASTI